MTEVIDDAPGVVHPGGAAGRCVIHHPVGEGRGDLVQAPGGRPRPGIPVSGTFQPAGEEMSGPGDRQGHPRGQGTGETADPDVEADLGPVVPRCLPDRLEESRAARPTLFIRCHSGVSRYHWAHACASAAAWSSIRAASGPAGAAGPGAAGRGWLAGAGVLRTARRSAKAALMSLKSPCSAAAVAPLLRGA